MGQSLRPGPPWKRVDAERFWKHQVLNESDGFKDDFGVLASPELFLALVAAWLALFFATRKGVHSAGQVAWVAATLPYVVLTMLVIRGCTLPGAMAGLRYYLKPRTDRLAVGRTWLDAANQIIYSLGVGTGQMVAYGSYNDASEDVVLDAFGVALLNSFTSLFAGVAVFAMLGHKAKRDGVGVADVVDSGEGLAFVAYPDGLATLPAAGLWCFLFFAMLFMLALDSSMAMLEAWTTMLRDFGFEGVGKDERWRGFRRQDLVVGASCAAGFLCSLGFVMRPGIFWFALVDRYVVWAVFVVAGVECLGVAWCYGGDKLSADLRRETGRGVPRPVLFCWKFLTPFLCCLLGIASMVRLFTGDERYEGARAPAGAQAVGFFLMVGPVAVMLLGALDRRPSADAPGVELATTGKGFV